LQRRGWEIAVLTPQDYSTTDDADHYNAAQPFPITRLPSGRGAITEFACRWQALARALGGQRPDVLLASGQRSVWLAALLARRYGVPWVAVGHGTEFGRKAGWQAHVTRWAFRQATVVVCVSHFTQRLMHDLGVIPQAECVIPNGADADSFQVLPPDDVAAFRLRSKLSTGRLILTVGNVTERKGQEVIIRALPWVLPAAPDTHYLMVGLPTLQTELSILARQLGVEEHVHFLGRVSQDDLVYYLNVCDLFAMTSRMTHTGDCEGFGIAVVEAALCGKPAIVSADSGLAEAIVDGHTGLAVSAGDSQAVARALISLLTRDAVRREMGRSALRHAQHTQTWAQRGGEYEELLREIAQRIAQERVLP